MSQMTFLDQTADASGSSKKLFVGYVNKQGSGRTVPLWAYIKGGCYIEFVCNGIERVTLNTPLYETTLYPPFSFLSQDFAKQRYPMMQSVVAYYFVAAGHWGLFQDGGRQQVSLEALHRGCSAVAVGMFNRAIKEGPERRVNDLKKLGLEEVDPDPESLFVSEKWIVRKIQKTDDTVGTSGNISLSYGPDLKTNRSSIVEAVRPSPSGDDELPSPSGDDELPSPSGDDELTYPNDIAERFQKLCVNHQIMQGESNALERTLVRCSEEITKLKKQKNLLFNWMLEDKRVSGLEKKRRREALKNLE